MYRPRPARPASRGSEASAGLADTLRLNSDAEPMVLAYDEKAPGQGRNAEAWHVRIGNRCAPPAFAELILLDKRLFTRTGLVTTDSVVFLVLVRTDHVVQTNPSARALGTL